MTAETAATLPPAKSRRLLRRLFMVILVYLLLLLVSHVWYELERNKSSLLFGKVTKMSFAVESWALLNDKKPGDPISPPDVWLPQFRGIRESVAGEIMVPPRLVGDACGVRLTRRLLHFPAGTGFFSTNNIYYLQLPGEVLQPMETADRPLPYQQRCALRFLPFAWIFVAGSHWR